MSEQPANPQDSEEATAADAPAPLQPDEAPAAKGADSSAEESAAAPVATPAEAAEADTEHPTVAQAAAAAAPEATESPVAAAVGGSVPPPQPAQDWSPPADAGSGGPAAVAQDKPELAVGAAFAGGLALALILKRLAR